MPSSAEHDFERELLDLHLGHLLPAERAALHERLAREPALAAQHAALASVMTALNLVSEAAPPVGLTERIAARVAQAGAPPRVVRPQDGLTKAVEKTNGPTVLRLGNLRDLIAVAAMIVLAIGIGAPSLMHMRERGQRLGCSYNLAQLGRGLQQYAATNFGSLPFVGWGSHSSWAPTSEPDMQVVPNRRHMYPLLRQAYVLEPRLFICPGTDGVPMPRQVIPELNDFLESRNVAYSYQNMAGVRPSAEARPDLTIMADETPLFADGLPLFDLRRLAWQDPAKLNSRSHRGAGQNLLSLSGQVRWTNSPTAGINGDNIWTLANITAYTGREGPLAATDAHLLK